MSDEPSAELLEEVNRIMEFRSLLSLQNKANGRQFNLNPCPKCNTNELLFLDVNGTEVRCLRCGNGILMDPVQLIAEKWGCTESTPAMKYVHASKSKPCHKKCMERTEQNNEPRNEKAN